MRPVPQIALDFLKGAEGDRLTAYRDSAGVWTIGRGHTGPEVVPGLVISEAQSDAYLFADATKAAVRLALRVKAAVLAALSDHEYAALVSFVFNLGADPKWQIWRALNESRVDDVPVQMMRFDKAHVNGAAVVVPGLHNRRAAEVTLWRTADAAAAAIVAQAAPEAPPPSSWTRDAVTPPTPVGGKPLGRSKSFVATAATAVVASVSPFLHQLQGAAETLNRTLAPYAGSSAVLQHLQEEITLGLAGLAVLGAFLVWLKSQEARTQ